jgi:hypothetical protein
MTEPIYQVNFTLLEISTILYYAESGLQGVDDNSIEPEVYSIFSKLENIRTLRVKQILQFTSRNFMRC